jgi:hypothetical protein
MQESSTEAEFFGPMAVGQKPEVADAHKPVREDMHEKPPDEFVRIESQDFLPVAIGIISPRERHFSVFHAHKAVIGDRDAVSVAAEVVKDLFGSSKRWFGKDDPVGLATGFEELVEGLGIRQVLNGSVKFQLAIRKGFFKRTEKEIAIAA